MGIISWVQCTLREVFCLGGLTRMHFWKNLLGRDGGPNSVLEIIFLDGENHFHTFPKTYPC